MSSLNIGLIGNCQVASLVDDRATMVWACMPQFDSDPVFCRLLRDGSDMVRGRKALIALLDAEKTVTELEVSR